MVEATVTLARLVPSNKTAFADFIDCLYWIFYEGAGKDKLRYLVVNGGSLVEGDCDVIWAIKTFRNKWLRHDPDHGDSAKIRSSYKTLREILQHFGFPRLPDNARDYKRLQMCLVNALIDFMETLKVRLS